MSESDVEFERFLQESLSSSGISRLSRSSSSEKFGVSSFLRKQDDSDQELEATGNSWLKSSNPMRQSLQITLPSIGESKNDYSKDSLESPKSGSDSRKQMKLVTAVGNVVNASASASPSDGSSTTLDNTKRPGLDTLEENIDKSLFFAELEQDRDTPINYSELNKGLSATDQSSLTTSGSLERKLDSQYKDDFETLSSHDDTSSGLSNNTTITPMESNTNIADNGPVQQQGFTLSPIHSSDVYSSMDKSRSVSDFDFSSWLPRKFPVRSQGATTSRNEKSRANETEISQGRVIPLKSQASNENDKSTLSPSRMTASRDQEKFVSLRPTSINASDSEAESDRDISSNVLLGAEKIPSVVSYSELAAKKHEVQSSTMINEGTALEQNGNNNNFRFGTGKMLNKSPLHPEVTSKNADIAAESLTLVTEMPNSSLGGISSEMAELQSALIAAGLPQINSAVTTQPNSTYTKTDLKDVIRAIASEELTTVSKKIFEGDLRGEDPSLSPFHQKTLKKESGGGGGGGVMSGKIKHISEPPAQPQRDKSAKKPPPLSNRRDSQGSRTDASFRKQTVTGKHGKENISSGNRPTQQRPKHLLRTNNKSVHKIPRKPQIRPKTQQSKQKQVLCTSPKFSPASPSSDGMTNISVPGSMKAVDNSDESLMMESEESHTKLLANETALDLAALELEYKQREEEMRLNHEKEITELKQELFAQSVKLRDLEVTLDSRKLLASGKDPDMFISREEKEALQREIKEQELLLQGYQKENERLYAELSSLQKDLKSTQTRLYQENQQLASELANTRAQIEAQSHRSQQYLEPPSAPSQSREIEAARIAQLEDLLERGASEKRDLQNQVKQVKHIAHCLEQEIRSLKHKNKDLESNGQSQDRVVEKVTKQLKTKHQEEIADLTAKLDQCTVKLKVVEHTSELLSSREVEIKTLKEKLASLPSQKSKPASRAGLKNCATTSETKRVHQLEKQVKELEKIIQRRFPNSLSALILAANSSTALEHESIERSVSRVKELEECVKELRSTLETTESGNLRKYEKLQERYTELELKYEQQAASISKQLQSHQDNIHTNSSGSGSVNPQLHRGDLGHRSPRHSGRGSPPSSSSSDNLKGSTTTKFPGEVDDTGAITARRNYEKLSEVNLELAHQRVQLEGKLAEAERKVSLANEEAQNKLTQLEKAHHVQMDSLITKFSREHSLSEITRLQSQLRAKEATIGHLKEKIECLEYDADQLASSKAKEEKLIKQLKTTSEDLLEARRNHTPEMHHFMILQSKIANLEERNRDFEEKNKLLWQNTIHSISDARAKEMEHKWRCQLVAKNAEIEQYREEVDSLLAALRMLQHRSA